MSMRQPPRPPTLEVDPPEVVAWRVGLLFTVAVQRDCRQPGATKIAREDVVCRAGDGAICRT